MGEEDANEIQLDSDLFMSPLRTLAVESMELANELLDVGMPDALVAQILSHMLSDAVLYRTEYESDDDEDEDDEDDLPDERDF